MTNKYFKVNASINEENWNHILLKDKKDVEEKISKLENYKSELEKEIDSDEELSLVKLEIYDFKAALHIIEKRLEMRGKAEWQQKKN